MKLDSGQGAGASPTIFHVTHYKAGSQWVYAFLIHLVSDRIVKPIPAAAHVARPLVPGGVYPTVYLTREELDAVDDRTNSRRIVVLRDLRDTLVSLYYSHRYSHSDSSRFVAESRRRLASLDVGAGLEHLLVSGLANIAKIQRSWLDSGAQFIKYEDLIADEYGVFERFAEMAELDLPRRDIHAAVKAVSFFERSGRELGSEDRQAHLRKGIPGDWKNHFDESLISRFKKLYGDLLVKAGYEPDDDW